MTCWDLPGRETYVRPGKLPREVKVRVFGGSFPDRVHCTELLIPQGE